MTNITFASAKSGAVITKFVETSTSMGRQRQDFIAPVTKLLLFNSMERIAVTA